MKYTQPFGNADPNAAYVNGNPATGTPGSIIPAGAVEPAQREIVAVIAAAGLTPTDGNNTQLLAALQIAANPIGTDTGTANALVVNLGPGFALAPFAKITAKALNTVTGPTTIQVSTNAVLVGTFAITRTDQSPLNPYDIVAGEVFNIVYDGVEFQLQKAITGGTGQLRWLLAGASLTGWVTLNGQTIGSAASGATGRAAADCLALYSYIWSNFSNSLCPVTGGRGASGPIDFAANKPIQLPDAQCKALIGKDAMGTAGATSRLNGVPVGAGNAATSGSTLGEALHTLLQAELPAVAPTFTGTTQTWSLNQTLMSTGTFQSGVSGGTLYGNPQVPTVTITPAGSISNLGSGTAHDNTQLSLTAVLFARL